MRKRLGLLIAAAIMVATTVSAISTGPAAAHECPDGTTLKPITDQRTDWDAICHRTGSATNPYVAIAPNCTAVREDGPGHLPHNPAGPGEDIDLVEEECLP